MIVHGASLSPFVRKTVAFAREKGLDFEHRPVPPGAKDDAFRAMSPFGKIPAFEDGDYKLSDSSAICHYLDAKFPAHPLIPADAAQRGKAIWYDEIADTVFIAAMGAVFFNRIVAPLMGMEGDLAAADKAEKETLPPLLDWLEGHLPDSGFLVGAALTLADLAMVSPFPNFTYAGVEIDAGKYPKVVAYRDSVLERGSFAELLAADKAVLKR